MSRFVVASLLILAACGRPEPAPKDRAPLRPVTQQAARPSIPAGEAAARCAKRDGAGCLASGLARLGSADYATAKSAFETACRVGVMEGCARLALLYHQGLGVERDVAQAVFLSDKACAASDMLGCYYRGLVYETDSNDARDATKKALELYQRSCSGGTIEACAALVMAFTSGRCGAPKDPVQASEFRQRACELGDKASCATPGDS